MSCRSTAEPLQALVPGQSRRLSVLSPGIRRASLYELEQRLIAVAMRPLSLQPRSQGLHASSCPRSPGHSSVPRTLARAGASAHRAAASTRSGRCRRGDHSLRRSYSGNQTPFFEANPPVGGSPPGGGASRAALASCRAWAGHSAGLASCRRQRHRQAAGWGRRRGVQQLTGPAGCARQRWQEP